MMKTPKSHQKEDWNLIANKLPLYIIKFIDYYCAAMPDFLNVIEKEFRLPDISVTFIEEQGVPDWINYYTKTFPANSFIELLLKSLGLKTKVFISLKLKKVVSFLEKLKNKKANEKTISNHFEKNKLKLIFLYRVAFIDFICLLTFGKRMHELIEEAKNGNDSALFQILQMDKGLVATTWINKRVRKASLQADQSFFNKLSEALIKPLNIGQRPSGFKLSLFLKVFWPLGLHKLTNNELAILINHYQLYYIDDPESLRKFLNRLGFKKSSKIDCSQSETTNI